MRRVVQIDPVRDARWDDFIRSREEANPYHLGLWARVLGGAFGARPRYLIIEGSGGEVEGALPLVFTWGAINRGRLRSLPFLGSPSAMAADSDGKRLLLEAACALAERSGARVLALTAREDGHERLAPKLSLIRVDHAYVAPLTENADELRRSWKKTSNNLWRSLKKAEQRVHIRVGEGDADLRAFYGLYLETMRRHRSLPLPLRFFQLARDELSAMGAYRLLLAEHEGEVVGAGVFYAVNGSLDLAYNASAERHLDLRPNHAIYWAAIRWGIDNGMLVYNMGAAPVDGSLARFKSQWGGVPEARYHLEYRPGDADATAADAARQAATRLDAGADMHESTVSRLWGSAPLPATRVAGELIFRAV